jgi:hypothetical protein
MPHGIFSTSGASASGVANLGFDFAWGYNRAQMDTLSANGLKALVFLGGINDATCTWNWSDDTVRTKVTDLRTHPATFGYYLADEPGGACASAVRDRNALVKSLDPDHLTVIAELRTDDFDELAGTTDVMAIVTYPCNKVLPACRPTRVPDAVRAAEAAGVPHYWGVVQSFEDDYYRMPTPAELTWLLGQWHDSQPEGLIAYTWDCCGDDIGLRDHAELWPTWQAENGSAVHALPSN